MAGKGVKNIEKPSLTTEVTAEHTREDGNEDREVEHAAGRGGTVRGCSPIGGGISLEIEHTIAEQN